MSVFVNRNDTDILVDNLRDLQNLRDTPQHEDNKKSSVLICEIYGTSLCSPPLWRFHFPMTLMYVSIRLLTIFCLSCLAAMRFTEILLESINVSHQLPMLLEPL